MKKKIDEDRPDDRKISRTPKLAVVIFCSVFLWSYWRHWNATKTTQKYHHDCSSLVFRGQPTSACYETNASAIYEDERNGTGHVLWYDIRITLPNGREIVTMLPSLNPPRYLNADSMNGSCLVRVWRGKVVEVKNDRLHFSTEDNPETKLVPQWEFILFGIGGFIGIMSLSYDMYAKYRLRSSVNDDSTK